MLYYRVIRDGVYDHNTGYTTILNEIVTQKERHKRFNGLSDKVFDAVNINKNSTFWSFGARFECKSA